PVIGIWAPEADVHARAVARELSRQGSESLVFDTRAAHEHAWHWRIGAPPAFRGAGGRSVRLDELRAIWLRRPYATRPPPFVRHPDDRVLARNEWRHLLDAFLAETEAALVNRPDAEATATKPRQLEAARR